MGYDIQDWVNTFEKIYWAGGMPWAVEAGILSPILMPHAQTEVPRSEVQAILRQSGALLATWTTEWNCNPTEWWYTCCDVDGYSLETIENQRGKRSVKSGLKNCTVRQVPPTEFARLAYPIYVESLASYQAAEIPTEATYLAFILRKAQYPGTAYWGAFHGDVMVAFSTCFMVNQAVSLGSTKSLKAFNHLNANSALFFEICRYYLNEGGALYVSNGRRNLLHPTSINDFLERMGFRKIYGRMHIALSPTARLIHTSRVARWGKILFLHKVNGNLWDKIEGFGKLMEIKKAMKKR